MEYSAEERALIWLCGLTDTEPRERVLLLRAAGSAEKLFLDPEKFFARVIKKDGKRVYKEGALEERRERLDAFLAHLEECGYFAVTAVSGDFPPQLAAADPPLVLFGAGNRALLRERMFCIVGSRITPPWAADVGTKLSERISSAFAVVTGLAEGGDLAAIRGALPSGRIVCVLPNGLDECYPAAHAYLKEQVRRAGLLLSEYPPQEKVRKYSFHARNRILAGLSEGVLVLSAGEKSGALLTAGFALDYGRDVFALPYNVGVRQGAGANELIKKGAYLCTCAADILDLYGFPSEEPVPAELSEGEARILGVLRPEGELHTAVIAERAGMPVYEAAAHLASLELKGLVVKAGGNRYGCVK